MLAAADNQRQEVIFLLARAGTDLSEKDANGMDALLYALSYGEMNHQDARIAVALVRVGANINTKDPRGMTPLMFAIGSANAPSLIFAFLGSGADAKIKDGTGKTALDYARENPKLKGSDAIKALEKATNS